MNVPTIGFYALPQKAQHRCAAQLLTGTHQTHVVATATAAEGVNGAIVKTNHPSVLNKADIRR